MKLPNIKQWIQRRKVDILISICFIEYFIISFFIGAINSLIGAYFFFNGLAALLFYYVTKTS